MKNKTLLQTIIESLDTTNVINWRQVANGELAETQIGNHMYRLMIESNFLPELKQHKALYNKNIGFISFGLVSNDVPYNQSITGTVGADSLTVFSVISNAFKERYMQQYDIVFLVAKDPERVSLYSRLAMRMARETSSSFELMDTTRGTVFVIAKFDTNPILDWLGSEFDIN